MVEPRTRLSDYVAYRTDLEALENAHLAGDVSGRTLKTESKALLKSHPGVYPGDIHYFDDFKGCSMFVYNEIGVSSESIDLLNQEFRHYVVARGQGLKCGFGCAVLIDDSEGNKSTVDLFVAPERIPEKDARVIANNPKSRNQELGDII